MQLPPLPVLQELQFVLHFCLDCLDDALEDGLKFLLFYCLWYGSQHFFQRTTSLSPSLSFLASFSLILALHPAVDAFADNMGDQTLTIQNALRELCGYHVKQPEQDDEINRAPLMIQVLRVYPFDQ